MKRKLKGLLGATILIPTVSFIIFYLFVSFYYTDGFTFNTRVNGIYCTGKTVEEVNSELVDAFSEKGIKVVSKDYETEEVIPLADFDYSIDYTDSLKKIFGSQNPFLWIMNGSKSSPANNIEPKVIYNEDKLQNLVSDLELVKDHTERASYACKLLYIEDEGYCLYEKMDELIDTDKLYDLVKESIDEDFSVSVPQECFYAQEATPEMMRDKRVWSEIEDYLNQDLSFDMGDGPLRLNRATLSDFLVYDNEAGEFVKNEDGSLYINREATDAYIDALCDRYDTYGMPREFVTHLGDVKNINFSIYGTLLDRKAEKEFLYTALVTGEEGIHVPKYIEEPYKRGLNDIGDTYVEVDLTRQVLYYIKDGDGALYCDVVTGKPSAGFSTPEMVCYVYGKVPGKYLRGEGYCSYVNFWMPVYKAIGLHDASWQSAFGGDRYLSHGSRGCINMRYDDAKALYDDIEIGTPVIVYK